MATDKKILEEVSNSVEAFINASNRSSAESGPMDPRDILWLACFAGSRMLKLEQMSLTSASYKKRSGWGFGVGNEIRKEFCKTKQCKE